MVIINTVMTYAVDLFSPPLNLPKRGGPAKSLPVGGLISNGVTSNGIKFDRNNNDFATSDRMQRKA